MSRKTWSIILAVIGVLCIGAAAWYPISYFSQKGAQQAQLDDLRAMRGTAAPRSPAETTAPAADRPEAQAPAEGSGEGHPAQTPAPAATDQPEASAQAEERRTETDGGAEALASATASPAEEPPVAPLPEAEDHGDWAETPTREQVEARILPELRPLYELNPDFIGWIEIPGTEVNHPVVQTPEENDRYLYRSFDGEDNRNGTLILEGTCDPYTPSANLIIYGHNMRSGMMFGRLDEYLSRAYWAEHKLIRFDVLTEPRTYVVVACVQSTQIEGGGHGSFRYTAEFEDEADLETWLDAIRRRRRFDTGVDFGTGDHYLTLSTCAYHEVNGRLLVIARQLRPGEDIDHLQMTGNP